MWTAEFESDSTLGVMADCYNTLKSKSNINAAVLLPQTNLQYPIDYKFEAPSEPPPPAVDDETRRREEEELQRVLEMSVQDKGGRSQWAGYSAASSSGAGGSGSGSSLPAATSSSASGSSSTAQTSTSYSHAAYPSGYVPARTPSPNARTASPAEPASAVTTTSPSFASQGNIVTRVRALHTFEPTEAGELAFEKGDVIKVVDRGYKDWWRGQLKGRTGIFPVNYVVSFFIL
jgi:signal transducing adaptor molecule